MLNHSSVEIGPNNKYAYKMSNFAVRYNTSQRQLNTARRGFAFRVIRRFAFAAIRFAKKCEGRGWISWTVAIVNAAVAIAPRDPLIRIAAVEFALSCSEDRWAEALLFDDFDESIFAKRIHFYRLAKICLYLERVSDAIKYLRIAEPALSSSWAVCHLLGSAYLANSDLEGAVNWFQKSQCLAITKRRRIDSLWSEACAYRQFGDPKSIDIDSQIIALDPESNVCRFGIVGVSPELNATSTIADEMRSTLLSANLNLRNRAAGHFALGTLHERSGDLTTAFLHFTLGNQVRSLMQSNLFLRWSRDQCKTKWDFFSAEKIQELSRFGDRQMQLICIVGMPRSGTTMLESIFNMHPQIEGIGERNDLQRQLVNFFPLQLNTTTRYPYCCNKITPDTIRKVSEFVSMRYRRIAKTGKPWLATKTP